MYWASELGYQIGCWGFILFILFRVEFAVCKTVKIKTFVRNLFFSWGKIHFCTKGPILSHPSAFQMPPFAR